ncbi:hypothetical protein M0805_005740 [Coniferiporia weirii]|nr:hypothetical protein M0805_005740 [Coniferiporia weirii]
MARRKRVLDDGDDSDSSVGSDDGEFDDFGLNDDPGVRAGRELLENPYGRKRRRKAGGKDDATYGVFGEDSEDEGFGGRRRPAEKRSDWAKAPAFVSGEKKVNISEDVADIKSEEDAEEEDAEGDESDNSEASSVSKPPSPRVRMEEEEEEEEEVEERPQIGGIGSKNVSAEAKPSPSFAASGTGIGSGGMGATKGGIGSPLKDNIQASLPSAFGASRPQRSFVRGGSGSAPGSGAATPLSATEQVHFGKLSGTFGARMLSKMGWQAGTGLGAEKTGIVTPVESRLRPKGMGIAFKGFKEKTAQSKAEARRRGEVVSDEEEKVGKRVKGKGKVREQAPREDAWKKPKKTKVKVEHKTYEEIIAEAGGEAPPPGIGIIIDATGATPREVSSIADVSLASWTPSTDPMRIPEVRHNLRLIADACKVDLEGLAREAKALEDRKKWIQSEDPRLRRKIDNEAELIRRLQAVHIVVDDLNTKVKEAAMSDYEPSLEAFSSLVERLVLEYPKEYDHYRLDELVVAAVVPTFRRMMAAWRPLEEPSAYTSVLRRWRNALKMSLADANSDMKVDIFGARTVSSRPLQADLPMTPYESLLWNVWLPKIRSFINNDWLPTDPSPAVKIFESWSDVLPAFIRDNLLDQLILPKVTSAIVNWRPKQDSVSLQTIVFPWLPHVGLRMEAFIDDARRRVKSMLRSWVANDGVPKDLLPWKEVFKGSEWEDMLLKYVVPKLGATLRDDFRVNPRNQDMEPLKRVLEWSSILRPSVLGQLLETEFFPKWLDVLHIWLVQPSANFEEVAQWYQFWKGALDERTQGVAAVERGFTRGLQMINHALELGPDAPTKLPPPDHKRPADSGVKAGTKAKPGVAASRGAPPRSQEITFRAIVEEFVAAHNLLFLPAGQVHAGTRLPLFRVTGSVGGKGGLLVYLLDDAVWAPDGDEYRAVTLEDMVVRATKGR